MAIKITEEQIDRQSVEQVFGLTGGELAESEWKVGDKLIAPYWYEGAPEYASEHRDDECRTAVFDASYADIEGEIVEANGAKWQLVASYRSSGETECLYRDGSPGQRVTRDECRLVADPYRHSDTTCAPGSGRYGKEKAKRAECPFCEARIGEEHGHIYLGDGWVEAVYKLVPAPDATDSED